MYNHLILVTNINPLNLSTALKLYEEKIQKNIITKNNIKNYLHNLNIFTYTYYLITYNKNLEELAKENDHLLKNEDNINILIELGKTMIKKYSDSLTSMVKISKNSIIKKALEFVNKNYYNKITLKEIANSLHVSKNYLCYLFKKKTGYRFCEYVNILRINRAKKLIVESQKNFDYISFDCGFASQSHFSSTFKKYTGITPSEYKNSKK
ncbi:helix-turn-helix domain-containing protein [Anaerosphaera multitolerans]|uniref:AraC family transcriptional regulator n=1 Tax=Anaerosphaera multitolerans TaxID=2487351 RepID=A0A437S7Y5_9FIRM|nr:AraC family transcriptional regulator [Anaerosphaera multitolerans]RVU55183.1 AraC family transcriptional regulator [Anaerosphaera multitolerans]